jgi:DNA-binding CsgD family transcriptional regulator
MPLTVAPFTDVSTARSLPGDGHGSVVRMSSATAGTEAVPGARLIGRSKELAEIAADLFDAEHGVGVVVRGPAGIGKTALIAATAKLAATEGYDVRWCAGSRASANLPFFGLRQIADHLPGAMPTRTTRGVLERALTLPLTEAVELQAVAVALAGLLSQETNSHPHLVVVDDAHWLDQASSAVLALVARLLGDDRSALLVATRAGDRDVFQDCGMTAINPGLLSRGEADELLAIHRASLTDASRRHILGVAQGNPLVLLTWDETESESLEDLTTAIAEPRLPSDGLSAVLCAELDQLPAATNRLLLLAACQVTSSVSTLLAAAQLRAGEMDAISALQQAIDHQLVTVRAGALVFHCRLLWRAVLHRSTAVERQGAHRALASTSETEAGRTWHLAAACLAPDRGHSNALISAAQVAVQRGDGDHALRVTTHAAALATDRSEGARGFLAASELADDEGRFDLAQRLVARAAAMSRGLVALSVCDRGPVGELSQPEVSDLVHRYEAASAANETDHARHLLRKIVRRCWWHQPEAELMIGLTSITSRLGDGDDARRQMLLASSGHAGSSASDAPAADSGEPLSARAGDMHDLASAAHIAGDDRTTHRLATACIATAAARGLEELHARTLTLRAWTLIALSQFSAAVVDAEDGARMARATGQPLWAAYADAARSLLSGLNGDVELSALLARASEQVAFPAQATLILADVQRARGIAALTVGDYTSAYNSLARIFDPSDPAFDQRRQHASIGDLADAARGCRRTADVDAILGGMGDPAPGAPPRWSLALRLARALNGTSTEALALLGLTPDALTAFDRARLQLMVGIGLRRERQPTKARQQLVSASEIFGGLGLELWSDRAEQEHRATGLTSRRGDHRRDELTPQELEIARLASIGLSNRQIGEQLFLSHRTISSHLYRIYPKLGIASRAGLRTALEADVAAQTLTADG